MGFSLARRKEMVRKAVFFSLVMVFVLAGLVSMASAAQNVANTTQKGSLLIFPKIMAIPSVAEGAAPLKGPGGIGQDELAFANTYIFIANDYYQEVWVKCYWVDEDQQIEDFQFRLTPNQPIVFGALQGLGDFVTVPPFVGLGELKCWAVNAAGDQQIAFNHLYGNALILTEEAGVVYNAYSFTARGVAQGAVVGTGGNLKLTGNSGDYDACPQYLVTNFVPSFVDETNEDRAIRPDLTLVPCKQDLRQDRVPTCTKAKFDIWNENETKYTGAYQCFKCWYEGMLDEIGVTGEGKPGFKGFGGEKFTLYALKTLAARFRVTGVASTVCSNALCTGGQTATPLLGLMLYARDFEIHDGIELEFIVPYAGYTPHGAGVDGTGFILWDKSGDSPEVPAR
jgi:hypothetical protein